MLAPRGSRSRVGFVLVRFCFRRITYLSSMTIHTTLERLGIFLSCRRSPELVSVLADVIVAYASEDLRMDVEVREYRPQPRSREPETPLCVGNRFAFPILVLGAGKKGTLGEQMQGNAQVESRISRMERRDNKQQQRSLGNIHQTGFMRHPHHDVLVSWEREGRPRGRHRLPRAMSPACHTSTTS